MSLIESSKNPHFRRWLSLLEGPGVKKQGQFLLMGKKLVPELLSQSPDLVEAVIWTSKVGEPSADFGDTPRFELSGELFRELDLFNTRHPIILGKVPDVLDWNSDLKPTGLEILTGLGDPSNLGALLRVSEAFGAKKVVLLREAANPFHPKCLRASAGSALRMEFLKGPSISELNGEIVGLDMNGTPIDQFTWPQNPRILMGEEGQGLPKNLKSSAISIPMQGKVESLNAVSAASIALYSYFSSQKSSS